MATLSNEKIKVGVIGAGRLGRWHAEKYERLPQAQLMGIYDTDTKAGSDLAARLHVPFFKEVAALIECCDAVSIAVPVSQHELIGRQCLLENTHVLMEKPLAATLKQAQSLVALAKSQGCLLQVGHIERFNPAFLALRDYHGTLRYLQAMRLTPYQARGGDVSVVYDLMSHDVDLVLALVQAPVDSVQASGMTVVTNHIDHATAEIKFASGVVAHFTASRVYPSALRRLQLIQDNQSVLVDFATRNLHHAPLEQSGSLQVLQPSLISTEATQSDPLQVQLSAFLDCIQLGARPLVDGEVALKTMEVLTQIEQAITDGD